MDIDPLDKTIESLRSMPLGHKSKNKKIRPATKGQVNYVKSLLREIVQILDYKGEKTSTGNVIDHVNKSLPYRIVFDRHISFHDISQLIDALKDHKDTLLSLSHHD